MVVVDSRWKTISIERGKGDGHWRDNFSTNSKDYVFFSYILIVFVQLNYCDDRN